MGRRGFLGATGSLAAASLLGGMNSPAEAQTTAAASNAPRVSERRKLGSLEVSSVGLGVQNVSRKYETTVPHRPEMINIIRTAFDRGVTFFDTAEAYGPHEAERILGEAVAPFRDKVVITSKFGWNIDLRRASGARDSTAGRVTSKRPLMACSSASALTASISSTSTAWIRRSRSKMPPARSTN